MDTQKNSDTHVVGSKESDVLDENSRGSEHKEKSTNDDKKKKNPMSMKKKIAAVVVMILAVVVIAFFIIESGKYESTTDAFVSGNPINISSNISAHIVKINVKNNTFVKKGTAILTLDSRAYKLNVKRIQAGISAQKAQVKSLEAKLHGEQFSVKNSEKTLKRLEALNVQNAVSKQELENALTQYQVALKTYVGNLSGLKAAKYDIAVSKSELHSALLNLSYTEIFAPKDGIITMNSVQAGDFVQAGTPIFSIVTDDMWVIGNFKETQLHKIHIGDSVGIVVDAIPGVTFKGTVQSFQAGTGSVFSLLPPENATGNFVKVVQRIPIKITFDNPQLVKQYHVTLGMSAVPKIKVNSYKNVAVEATQK